LVANALALSGLWYTATVLSLNPALLKELNSVLFSFVWSGKKELVACETKYLDKLSGGFKVVNVGLKVRALHLQWLKRFIFSPNKWCTFLSFFVQKQFGVSVLEVLSFPACYPVDRLPPFVASLLESWALLGGEVRNATLFLPDDEQGEPRPLSSVTTKLCYSTLLLKSAGTPHCVSKFFPLYGNLYWKDTWTQVHAMPLDRHVSDVTWKISHGVLYTAGRLISFGLDIEPLCFCLNACETLAHLFFECYFIQAVLLEIQTIFYRTTPLCSRLCVRHLLFGFDESERKIVPPFLRMF
jgi:hypothetical protein